MVRYLRSSAFICGCLGCFCFALAGCADKKNPATQPMTAAQRQEAALHDPMGYKTDTAPTDITGGSLSNFDKNAFKKDLDHVLSP